MTATAKPNANPADAQKLATLLGQCSNNTKGLRLDLAIALHNGQEIWLDHGNTHSTQSSMLQRTSNFMHDLYKAENSHGPGHSGRIDATLRSGKYGIQFHFGIKMEFNVVSTPFSIPNIVFNIVNSI
jgi:hypothetical protein